MSEQQRLAFWFHWLRLAAVVGIGLLAILERDQFPPGYERWAWLAIAAFALGSSALWLAQRNAPARRRPAFDVASLVLDAAFVLALQFVFAFSAQQPLRALVFLVVAEGALRFGVPGGLAIAVLAAPFALAAEAFREDRFGFDVQLQSVTVRFAVAASLALIVGRLVERLIAETQAAHDRASEAELLRDELGRRVDVLEAANRCARALGSSLVLDEAFSAFLRELQGLVPFDRVAIVLAEDGLARVMAAAGAGEDEVFPAGTARPVEGSVLEEVLQGRLVLRDDLDPPRYPEEEELLTLGLRCRLGVPVLLGARAIGMLSVVRREPRSFRPEEIELVSLLGRLVATAVQNIRAYEAERSTVEELRRLSALRADFVSLVSHELRSPMASVIGSARTLQARWRELTPEQRESFLAVIAGETSRLATLIGDVLDTSRIEAGTFSYAFTTLDVGDLVRETVDAVAIGIDEVRVTTMVSDGLPSVRGDRERLRQVLMNLIENAVKHSPAGEEVRVVAYRQGQQVLVDVADRGPGIAREHQRLIFEKFGRVAGNGAGTPGTGLGLFIARSIAEAHGGALDVRSAPSRGATFTLTLPASG